MGERVVGEELAVKILKEWLGNEYVTGTRSEVKVAKMREIDGENRK
jgi:ribose 5-phosphate isomerase RpiB